MFFLLKWCGRWFDASIDDFVYDPSREPVVRCEALDVFNFVSEFVWSAQSFSSVHEGSDPSGFVIPLCEAFKVDELCRVGFFSVNRNSIRVYFQIEEVWDTVIKFVDGEFEVLVEIVETFLDFVHVFWFDE